MLFQDSDRERRHHARIRFDAAVEMNRNDWSESIGSLAADISEGGLRLKVAEYLQPGMEMTLTILMENRYLMELPARVVWSEKERYTDRYQAGVEFLEADATQFARRKIHDYIHTTERSSRGHTPEQI